MEAKRTEGRKGLELEEGGQREMCHGRFESSKKMLGRRGIGATAGYQSGWHGITAPHTPAPGRLSRTFLATVGQLLGEFEGRPSLTSSCKSEDQIFLQWMNE
jgi:hypothetical protein